jgi:hypothetical protein
LLAVLDNEDLVNGMLFGTWVLKDIEQGVGGNPFDNRSTIYTGTSADNVLNDRVKHYAAEPGALAALLRYYALTGHITRPILAIHTTYDPLIVQSVKHDGHCNITLAESEHRFAELRQWAKDGLKPNPGPSQ